MQAAMMMIDGEVSIKHIAATRRCRNGECVFVCVVSQLADMMSRRVMITHLLGGITQYLALLIDIKV